MWIKPEASKAWRAKPSGKRGAPRNYSHLAIETALTLRLVFRLPLRQAEGFLRPLLDLKDLSLEAPDHTTLSRRSRELDVKLERVNSKKGIHLIIDSTGLSMVGEGEWATAKHGKRGIRGWRKLHIGVDRQGHTHAQVLTDSSVDDASTGLKIIKAVSGKLSSLSGDAAYDTVASYDAADVHGAKVVVPPSRSATVSRRRPRSAARDRTIKKVERLGRRRWKKVCGYHRQGTVENTMYRYKSMTESHPQRK